MTREEEILNAALEYNNGITLSSPSNVLHFEAGAKWADEHPKNVWHDAEEFPAEVGAILYRTTLGQFRTVCHGTSGEGIWKVFVKDYGVKEWAYISELLPKEPKGGEE